MIAAAEMAGIQNLKMRSALDIPCIFLLALSLSRKLTFRVPAPTRTLLVIVTSSDADQPPESSLKTRKAFSTEGAFRWNRSISRIHIVPDSCHSASAKSFLNDSDMLVWKAHLLRFPRATAPQKNMRRSENMPSPERIRRVEQVGEPTARRLCSCSSKACSQRGSWSGSI